jgi:membrane protein YqaA with SNARE-associated domain
MYLLETAFRPLRKLYDWTVEKAAQPKAERWLAFFAFIESSFFPVPPDVLLIAMTFSKREKALRYAFIAALFSILGGILGYLIGFGLFELVGRPIVDFYHLGGFVETVGARYEANAFITVFTAAFTPIPYKVITISAGLFEISFLPFMIASILGRSSRFLAVALILYAIGPKAKPFIEKYFEFATLAFTLILVLGFFAIRYL